jgi:hypothetical protein
MIGFIQQLFGRAPRPEKDAEGARTEQARIVAETHDLDQRLTEAAQQRTEARAARRRAEHLGPAIRAELEKNHFGERMAAALEPRGYKP